MIRPSLKLCVNRRTQFNFLEFHLHLLNRELVIINSVQASGQLTRQKTLAVALSRGREDSSPTSSRQTFSFGSAHQLPHVPSHLVLTTSFVLAITLNLG